MGGECSVFNMLGKQSQRSDSVKRPDSTEKRMGNVYSILKLREENENLESKFSK